MSQELDELSERYSDLLAKQKSSHDAPHITWVGARKILRRAIVEAYELGLNTKKPKTQEEIDFEHQLADLPF